ncbi:unnamed protein product [Meloidogyne enterolobii]|uniref:Uncharacterized protein n=1 Tax=Meloidogyne enterolobii TaxID=390850 RepID=A0ACB0Y9F1_MELEN
MANKNIYKKGKVYSSNPFSKIIEMTKGKDEIETEKSTQEQKDLVNSLTIELDKILYKNFEEEEEKNNIEEVKNVENKNNNLEEELPPEGLNLNDVKDIKMTTKFMNKLNFNEQQKSNVKKENIEEVKNVENKLEASLPKGLKLNDLENIKMIAKFMNKLTLSEQRKVNFPKAIELLVALHESDRIIENKNKICDNKNLIYLKKDGGQIEEIEEYLRDIVNIKKAKVL